MAKQNRAAWFKLFLHQKPLMDAVSDEALGRAIRAAMEYFETGEETPLEDTAKLLFLTFKPYIDEAFADYGKKSENGKKGGRPKKQTKPEVISENREKANETEAEADAEADAEAEEKKQKKCRAAKPPAPPSFQPPEITQIRDYCKKMGYQTDPEGFLDYYTANGWRMGSAPMQDWRAAVRNWHRKEKPHEKTESQPTWTVGVRL